MVVVEEAQVMRRAAHPLSGKIYDLAEAKIMILLSPHQGEMGASGFRKLPIFSKGETWARRRISLPIYRGEFGARGRVILPSPPRWGRKEFLMFSQRLSIRNSQRGGKPHPVTLMLRPRNTPKPPRRPPDKPALQHFRHRIVPPGAARSAAHEPKQRHERTLPQPMPGDCLIAIFRTGRRMAAGLADERGERELIGTDQRKAEKPAGCLGKRALPVAGTGMVVMVSTHRKARHESSPPLWGRWPAGQRGTL